MKQSEDTTFSSMQGPLTVDLQKKAMDLESGALGKFFGNRINAPTNVAGFVVVALVLAGVLDLGLKWTVSGDFWKISTPIITLALGFLFGKNS